MDKENFFTKFRRLVTTVENETERQEENMKKPIRLRSNGNHRPSHLIFKEMLRDAQNVKRDANQQLECMRSDRENFQDIVAAVQSLVDIQKIQLQETEDYLQQYGYVPYAQHKAKVDAKKPHKSEKTSVSDKENIPEDHHPNHETESHGKKEETQKIQETNGFSTPQKSSDSQQETSGESAKQGGNKTPQLSDFGLSQAGLDRIAMMKMPKPSLAVAPIVPADMYTPARIDRTYNLTNSTSMGSHYPPMTTPANYNTAATPFAPGTVLVTPGLFGNRHIPDQTPDKFIDKALPKPAMEDSPVPPILLTVKKWPASSSHLAPPSQPKFDTTDDSILELPQPSDVTIGLSEVIPAEPPSHHKPISKNHGAQATPPIPVLQSTSVSSHDSNATPPMPVFHTNTASTMPTAPVQLSTQHEAEMPCRPTLLADKLGIATTMPQEPVQLSSHIHHETEMPSRPVLLADTLGISTTMPVEPMQLSSQILNEIATPPPPVLLTQRLNHYIPSNLTKSNTAPQTPGNPIPHASVTTNDQLTNQTSMAQQYPLEPSDVGAMGAASHGAAGLPVGMTPQKPVSLTQMHHLVDDGMPKTPELTLTHKRFINIKPPVAPDPNHESQPDNNAYHQTAVSGGQYDEASRPMQIAPIMAEEFSQVQDYLQRILPLPVINGHIETLNQILRSKPDSSFITEEETKMVDLGNQLRVMLLLLCKLNRWKTGKSQQSNETIYIVL